MNARDRVKATLERRGIGFVERVQSIQCLDKHSTKIHFTPDGNRIAGARGSRSIIKAVREAAAAFADPRRPL